MRVSTFVSGMATGAVAGMVVSAIAATAMQPQVRRTAAHTVHKAAKALD